MPTIRSAAAAGRPRRICTPALARGKEADDAALHRAGAVYLVEKAAPSYGVMPGGGVHDELRLLQLIGLGPREALAAATGNSAEIYGWTDRGAVAPGRRADLVLLTRDPRHDVTAVDHIAELLDAGHLVCRDVPPHLASARASLAVSDCIRTSAPGPKPDL